ncbi:MAG: hypothetical protein V1774_04645 [Candidatus Eisenbacteria bacterium]
MDSDLHGQDETTLAQRRALLDAARDAARRSTAPPAERTGALTVTRSGLRFPGTAVRLPTAAGLSICAEHVALCAARAATDDPVILIALWVPSAAGDHPCGHCLQVWHELARGAPLLFQRGDEEPRLVTLETLLPDAFSRFERGS